ncbi:TonB-dependent receptor domain-containing protein [Colwellia polaris]|jgi:outer membrane receptor protein involved in Fe transport|uniref:TonB-dependent receptor domain-containing protein n=1 Tax=Colwellia polaris TaxID=326537 RepID=UPI000A177730|nr:TonB-dependent receptor [Colwellia polaris]
MNTNIKRFGLSSLAVAVLSGLIGIQATAQEVSPTQESDEAIEEVVVKVSRLKGTANAVIEERKNQAFVADILGAEQIARTGDSDAAAALRRVTGLTLVDGKFIYVRGLGERYSSTQLNGAAVPSPDPTRTVIPLDLFPSSIIESLSVQKSYSPSMPAHFGGGNVDIRLKSIPSTFVFNIAGNVGGSSENSNNGLTYEGGGDDWYGLDDGTRQAPKALRTLWKNYDALGDLSQEENRVIAADLYKDYDPQSEDPIPDFGLDMTIGNRFDSDSGDFRYGFLTALSYDNEWQVSEEFEGQDFALQADESYKLIRGFDDVISTEHSVRWSGMFNFGVEYLRDHKIDFSSTILHDTRDQIKEKYGNTNNVLLSDGLRVRDVDVAYEERELIVNQLRGSHTFSKYWFIGFDWLYSDSRSNRYAPGNISTRYILADENEDGVFDLANESSLRKATTASRYTFQNLDDDVEDAGWNLSLPLMFDTTEVELKAGAKYIEKTREAFARRIDVNTLAFDNLDLSGYEMNEILNDDKVLNHPLTGSERLIRDTSIAGDDYLSAQKVDAYYFEVDVFLDNTWRISGGVRWEDFRQVVAPLDPATGQFDIPAEPTKEDLAELTFKEDDYYGALALTYILDETMQFRASYGETTIRPDLREVAPATYIDPLTEFPIGGTPAVRSTQIKNYDLRWEWYLETGENLSVGLFYKDMEDPIESVQSPSQDGPPLIRIANADDGEVYGVEVEFMKDFAFLGGMGNDFFLSGNVTLSDSEINIDTQKVVEQTGVSTAITNPTRRMTGHSEYVVNMNLGYDHPNGNHTATLAYNVFGERIIIPGIDNKDDAYEQPVHSLDLIYTYYPTFATTLKFKVQNILDEEKEIEFDDTLLRSETRGIGFDIQFKWEFD